MKKIASIFCLLMALSITSKAQVATATLQSQILAATKANSVVTTNAATGTIVWTTTSVTTSGTVSAGFRALAVTTSSNFVGTVNSVSVDPSVSKSIPALLNYTYTAVPYVISSGTLIIDKAQ